MGTHGLNSKDYTCNFNTEIPHNVRKELSEVQYAIEACRSLELRQLLHKVFEKFEEHPVWQTTRLFDSLNILAKQATPVLKFMHLFTYRITNGPWQKVSGNICHSSKSDSKFRQQSCRST